MYLSLLFSLKIRKNLPHFLSISSLLHSPSPSFLILIPSFMCFIFFSSTSISMSHLYLIRQPSIPSDSSFLNVIMNRDFWGFWLILISYPTLNTSVPGKFVLALSGSSRRHSQIATYAMELFLKNSKFRLKLLVS